MGTRNVTVCPDCRFENVEGADTCANCGQDLRSLDEPRPESELVENLLTGHLGDVAAPKPPVVKPGVPVGYAIRLMQDTDMEAVLVTEDDRLVGILTERDVLLKLSDERTDLNAVRVADIMTPDPVVLRLEDSLAVAVNKMAVGGFRHIPLVDQHDRPVGLVSARQVFAHVSRVFH